MFVRQELDTTLADLRDHLLQRDDGTTDERVTGSEISFRLSDPDPKIVLGDREVPATETALQSFGDLLQIPQAFLKRLNGTVQASTVDTLLTDMTHNVVTKDVKVVLKGNFVQEVDEWGKDGIKPIDLVNTAINVIDERSPVARLVDSASFFGFDVYAPEGFAHGYGGDGVTPYADGNERDDITAGGLRMGVNLKQRLAPTVDTWFYRLACTNGYEIEKPGLRLDARGSTVDEVIAELESMAQIAFSSVEQEIAHFYELKQQRVENVERTLRSIARERSIPDRSTMALMDLAATDALPDNPTMFDVVNLVTNFANTMTRDGGRLVLERAGGSVIADHAARCGHCQQKVH